MKTTRKQEYGCQDYGVYGYSDEYVSFHKGSTVEGYIDDCFVFGTCTGNRRGDTYQGDTPEFELVLPTGGVVWANERQFSNVK